MSAAASARSPGRILSDVPSGAVVRLTSITGGRDVRMRLASMGLLPGVCLTLIQGAQRGPCILAVGGTRLAIGRGMARRLKVADP